MQIRSDFSVHNVRQPPGSDDITFFLIVDVGTVDRRLCRVSRVALEKLVAADSGNLFDIFNRCQDSIVRVAAERYFMNRQVDPIVLDQEDFAPG